MADVIARVRREMEDRLKEVEAELASVEGLIAEKAQLEHALASPPFATAATPARARKPAERTPTAAAAPKPKAVARKRKPAERARAPRGANRAAVFAALETMPGASVGEVAAAARIGRSQAYAVLRAGVEQGDLAAVELGGGQIGYRIDAQPETAFPAPAPVPPVEAAAEPAQPEELDEAA